MESDFDKIVKFKNENNGNFFSKEDKSEKIQEDNLEFS